MKRIWAKRWFKLSVSFFTFICVGILVSCNHFRVWSSTDYRAYHEVVTYPPGEDLWYGKVQKGDGLQAFLTAYPPHRMRQMGNFTQCSYYSVWPLPPNSLPMESLVVIAKDGTLVQAAAAGCTWTRIFFVMDPHELLEFERENDNYYAKFKKPQTPKE